MATIHYLGRDPFAPGRLVEVSEAAWRKSRDVDPFAPPVLDDDEVVIYFDDIDEG